MDDPCPGGMSRRLAIEGDGYCVSLMGGADNGEYLPIGAQCNRPDSRRPQLRALCGNRVVRACEHPGVECLPLYAAVLRGGRLSDWHFVPGAAMWSKWLI